MNIRALVRVAVAATGLACLVQSTDAAAVGIVSRSCRYTAVPDPIYVGNWIPLPKYLLLPGTDYHLRTFTEQLRLWSLEAFTVDWWSSGRFWLYAAAMIYEMDPTFGDYRYQARRFETSGWASEGHRSELPAYYGFFVLRARAGTGTYPTVFETMPPNSQFKVMGFHYAADPATGNIYNLGITRVSDCNMRMWGFERELAVQ